MAAAPRGRWVSTHSTRAGERAHLTEQQPTLMSEPPPVLLRLCEVKMSAVKRVYHCNRQLCTRESHMKYFCLKPEELLITVFFIFKNQICHKPCFCFCWLSWWWLTPSTFHPGIALLASVCFSPSVHFIFTVGDELSRTYIFQPLTCSICRCKKLWKIQLYLYGFNGILLLFWGRKAAPLCCKTKLDLVRLKCSVKLMEPGRPKCFCSSMK